MALFFFAACQSAQFQPEKTNLFPEAATGFVDKLAVHGDHFMVVSANPLATTAGYDILKKGGNAVDAAVAIQMVLNLVEPQSSGIGGGLFFLYHDHKARKTFALDGRETAPQAINPHVFLGADGKPLTYYQAQVGGKSVGTPGALKALWEIHKRSGSLPWKDLLFPAIEYAQNGFAISARLHMVLKQAPILSKSPQAQKYFLDSDGVTPKPIGTILKNPEFAKTLTKLQSGIDSFYTGDIARDIVTAVHDAYTDPGRLELADLKNYQVKWREPLCRVVFGVNLCGMPPPTSGGVAVLQILALLENFDLAAVDINTVEVAHLFAEASALAFADRDQYLADPDFVNVPVEKLLDKSYLKERSALISPTSSLKTVAPGNVTKTSSLWWSKDQSPEMPCTTHFSVIDADGNAVSVTSSIENAFGSALMVGGFLLNNQLTDFSFVSEQNGKKIANRIEAGKRPRSSMSPMMGFDDSGNVTVLLGSSGGPRIIVDVARTLLAIFVGKLDIQSAMEIPHIVNRNDGFLLIEKNTIAENWQHKLRELGHTIKLVDMDSGLTGVQRVGNGYLGGADPRREGTAMGE